MINWMNAKILFVVRELKFNAWNLNLDIKYIYKTKKFVRVKSLMGLKIWWNWRVDKPISKSPYVGAFSENHAQLQKIKFP